MNKEIKTLFYSKNDRGGYDIVVNINGKDIANYYYALDYRSLRREYKGYAFVKVEA